MYKIYWGNNSGFPVGIRDVGSYSYPDVRLQLPPVAGLNVPGDWADVVKTLKALHPGSVRETRSGSAVAEYEDNHKATWETGRFRWVLAEGGEPVPCEVCGEPSYPHEKGWLCEEHYPRVEPLILHLYQVGMEMGEGMLVTLSAEFPEGTGWELDKKIPVTFEVTKVLGDEFEVTTLLAGGYLLRGYAV